LAAPFKLADLRVAIVSYNTREALRRCLASLPAEAQVVVLDNASTDGSVEMVDSEFPEVVLLRSDANLGFGAGNNRILDLPGPQRAVLFLNSDARAEPGALETLLATLDDPRVVAAGGRLLHADGSLQQSTARELTLWGVFCEQFGLESLFRSYWNTRALLKEPPPAPTEQVMGACLLMRLPAVERFDERFFLYCEDTDLCARLRHHGQIAYEHRAHFTHELGTSSAQNRWLAVARYNRGKELYFAIHHGPWASGMCWMLNRLGALARLVVWTLLWPLKRGDQPRLWWRVLTARRPY
jgi:hypothetical protein